MDGGDRSKGFVSLLNTIIVCQEGVCGHDVAAWMHDLSIEMRVRALSKGLYFRRCDSVSTAFIYGDMKIMMMTILWQCV